MYVANILLSACSSVFKKMRFGYDKDYVRGKNIENIENIFFNLLVCTEQVVMVYFIYTSKYEDHVKSTLPNMAISMFVFGKLIEMSFNRLFIIHVS